jgi:hypothetical protein
VVGAPRRLGTAGYWNAVVNDGGCLIARKTDGTWWNWGRFYGTRDPVFDAVCDRLFGTTKDNVAGAERKPLPLPKDAYGFWDSVNSEEYWNWHWSFFILRDGSLFSRAEDGFLQQLGPSVYSDWLAGTSTFDGFIALAADGTMCAWDGRRGLFRPTRGPHWCFNILTAREEKRGTAP